ncbi:MAG: MarR family transcriptional regulator [Burkholderiales bacterium]|nr:MAG: MarR family transcriptional regulator [Burkholderiales bacterium]
MNLKQLLLARSDWFAREIMRGVRRSDYAFITPAQSRLLAHMGGKPMSMAEIARRLAISRQAVHKTVAELVRRGILQVVVDPERGNQKLVVYTQRGRAVNRIGAEIIESIEAGIAERLGAEGLAELKRLLSSDWGEDGSADLTQSARQDEPPHRRAA